MSTPSTPRNKANETVARQFFIPRSVHEANEATSQNFAEFLQSLIVGLIDSRRRSSPMFSFRAFGSRKQFLSHAAATGTCRAFVHHPRFPEKAYGISKEI